MVEITPRQDIDGGLFNIIDVNLNIVGVVGDALLGAASLG